MSTHLLPDTDSWKVAAVCIAFLSFCVACTALTITYRNFRLSRFPDVELHQWTYFRRDADAPDGDWFFEVSVGSRGLAIHNLFLELEADFTSFPEDSPKAIVQIQVKPREEVPNPMGPGQFCTFRARRSDIVALRTDNTRHSCIGFSDLPRDCVCLNVFGNGRLLKRLPGKNFDRAFAKLDRVSR